jgi:hypothetical protein
VKPRASCFLRCLSTIIKVFYSLFNPHSYSLDLNDPLYTATVVFKCFGKDFSPFQVNAVANIFKELASYNMICLENLHKDGRSTVIHLLDACFRANVLKDSYSQDQFEVSFKAD